MVFGDWVIIFAGLDHEHVLDILLGQGRAALGVALGYVGLHERTQHTLDVDAGVLEESAILTRDHGTLHVHGNVLDRHDLAVLRIERSNHRLAVGRVQRGFLRQAGHIEINALDSQGWCKRFRRVVRPEHGGHRHQAHDDASGDTEGQIREQQSERTSSGQGVLLGHVPHSMVSPVPLPRCRSHNGTVFAHSAGNAEKTENKPKIGLSESGCIVETTTRRPQSE